MLKVYQRVAKKLEDRIESGHYKPMSRLPSERELASEFEVSRTTIREALTALEAAGAISIKDRSGAYVKSNSGGVASSLTSIESTPGPHEVLQLRRLIEGDACFNVALQASDAAIEEILAACKANEDVPPDDTPEFHLATKNFHMSIMRASENSLYAELFDFLWEQKSGPLWEHWYARSRSRHNRIMVLANNKEIAQTIADRRPLAARTAMQHHIDWMISRFLGVNQAD